jgi:hypothetical protein
MASLSGSAGVVMPAPSLGGTGAFGGSGRQAVMTIPSPTAPLPPEKLPEPIAETANHSVQELPVRLIGLALALPTSSYFSNYEVFIAERRLARNESQLIKLVYESRPYQRRMSEYGLDNSKIYKLRVKRDTSCDETALQVAGSHYTELQNQSSDGALRVLDKDSLLPCYRTTADDYQKALAKKR